MPSTVQSLPINTLLAPFAAETGNATTTASTSGGKSFECLERRLNVRLRSQHQGSGAVLSSKFTIEDKSIHLDNTATACQAAGGRMCEEGCVLVSKKSLEQEDRIAWAAACTNAGVSAHSILPTLTEDDAKSLARCTS